MSYIKIKPMDYPLLRGESWFVVNPNNSKAEFKIPDNAITLCTEVFLSFVPGRVYNIVSNDEDNGWICVASQEDVIKMPYYVFARYFDAECFVRGRFSVEGKKTVPFDYKSTLEKFEDK